MRKFEYSLIFKEIQSLLNPIINSYKGQLLNEDFNNTNSLKESIKNINLLIKNMATYNYSDEIFNCYMNFKIQDSNNISSKISFYFDDDFCNLTPKYLITDASNKGLNISSCGLLLDKKYNLIGIIISSANMTRKNKGFHEYYGFISASQIIKNIWGKDVLKKIHWMGDIYISSALSFLRKHNYNNVIYTKSNTINKNFVHYILIDGICDKIASDGNIMNTINYRESFVFKKNSFDNIINYDFKKIIFDKAKDNDKNKYNPNAFDLSKLLLDN